MFMFWDEPNGQTNIQLWPRDMSNDSAVWMCKIERPLNNILVEVRSIGDIQRCMDCANIESMSLQFDPQVTEDEAIK